MGKWKLVQGLNGVSSTCGWMFRHMKGLCFRGANVFVEHKIPLFMEFWPKELKRNHSFDLLVDTLGRCYSKFICVQWYKQGKKEIMDIDALNEIADKHPDTTFDIFLIK